MEQSKEYYINNSTIKIVFGDITKSQTDVIVNSCGSKLTMSGGLSLVIREAGGEVIREDAQSKLPVNIGDVLVSTAGSLPHKYVFHCITIDKSQDHSNTPKGISESEIDQYIIGHSIDKCFQLLQAMDLESIAFPSIGAGRAGIPFDKVSAVMSESIARNLRKTNRSIKVELYLLDRFKKMEQWDFLPMFEKFSAQEAISKLMKEQIYEKLLTDEPSTQVANGALPETDNEVFISYSRKDLDIVKQIYESLIKSGIRCWLDVEGMYSGVSFKKVIVDAIKHSKVLLFMSSEHSNKSSNVVSEISLAMSHGKRIIPVRLDMTAYSESIEYDIINHDYVVYDKSRIEESNSEMLKKIASTLKMLD
jgi:O-acetyl-ADP-ribose deacetylase (regulator of RNase III)